LSNREKRERPRPRLVALALAAAGVALVGFPSAGRAHFQTYPYSLSGCPATGGNWVDPVTVVFYGYGTADRSLNHVRNHLGWNDESGTSQSFSSHNACGVMYGQKASGCFLCDRYHIRVRKTHDGDAVYGTTSVGAPHHEDFVWTCLPPSHAVDKGGAGTGLASGFDQGRQAVYQAFAGPHGGFFQYWGNTAKKKQCDGDYAGSNGNVFWTPVPSIYH